MQLPINIVDANACSILGAVTVDYSSFIYIKVQENRYKSVVLLNLSMDYN
ncbi:hypothetical protein NIES3974_03950 [Calothrix sp. NIES-3974]|nr:hypothetical protein NIES3974_03950 [Calothrix sp. NIES-3974]